MAEARATGSGGVADAPPHGGGAGGPGVDGPGDAGDAAGLADVPFGDDPEAQATEQRRRNAYARLSSAQSRLRRAEARLAMLESSTSLRIGQAVVQAARRPGRGLVTLPRDLYRIWRDRGSRASRPGGGAGRAAPVAGLLPGVYEEERLLSRSPSADGRLVVAGVLTARTQAALAPFADVVPLLPHDAALVIDRMQPDLVLVEAAATAYGPWANLGDPAVLDLECRLALAVDAARGRGCPAVLWRNAACPPAVAGMGWDVTEEGDLGVPLHRFGPVGLDPSRPAGPVAVGAPDRRAALGVRRSWEAVVAATGARPCGCDDPAPALRGHTVAVAGTADAVLAALACGARVIAPPSADVSDDDLRPYVAVVDDAAQAAAEAQAACRAGPRPLPEIRAVLRALFHRHATPVRLAALTGRLGIAADPLAARRVTVLARVADPAGAAAVTAALRTQTHPAAALLLACAGDSDAADAAAPDTRPGDPPTQVRIVRDRSWAGLARLATTPWVAVWDPGRAYPDTYLADLVCAAECSGADAVGPGDDSDSVAYSFAARIEPLLVRRELLAAGDPPDTWLARHGARLLAVRPDHRPR